MSVGVVAVVAMCTAVAACSDDDTPDDEAPIETLSTIDAGQAPPISTDLGDGSGEGGDPGDSGVTTPMGSATP